ncbi:MAG: Rne/Rng family ribonuclease [Oxalobacteraceae bacterium]|nr:Rne/Rng family ribonuclease [Oxalobacteraceae bacterium]
MKRMLFNATQQEELRVAIVDGQKLIDIDIETTGREQRKSNIYKGIITRIEPSLEACFVNYGEERHGFLPFKEVARSYFREGVDIRSASIRDALREGQEIVVQVEKEERGNKGAALTSFVSLAGRYLVLMPNNPRGGGVSRRVEGEDRQELREAMDKLDLPQGMSVIARTAGIGRNVDELQWDLNYLMQLWRAIDGAGKSSPGAFLIYQESSLVIRAIRDYFQPDIGEILIDTDDIFEQAQQFMSHVMPDMAHRVKRYREDVPLFSRFQIEHQIESAYSRTVALPSGGAIVIDHTEALVSVDVNSARSTRGGDIETTAFNTNVEAAEEVARQLRLRDLGGLIVIDFIDMENSKNQREVESRLKDALHYDRARVQMGKISRFGLMELSRQRLRPSLSEGSHVTCPRCNGTGHIRDTESSALQVLRIIQEEAMKENSAAIHVQAPVDVAAFLLNEKRGEILKIENRHRASVVLIPNKHLETPHYKLERIKHDDPRLDDLQASYKMAEEGDTDVGYSKRKEEERKPRQEAVVKSITPDQPAPIVDRSASKSQKNEPATEGFLSWLFSFFRSKPASEAPASSDSKNKDRERGERGGRGRNRAGRGRGGRDKDERAESRETKEAREPKLKEVKEPKQAKPPREPKEAREPKDGTEPRRERGGRQPREDKRPAAVEEKILLTGVEAANSVTNQPVTAAIDSEQPAQTDLLNPVGEESTTDASGEPRRRRRRGGRNRNRRDRDQVDGQQTDDSGSDDAHSGAHADHNESNPVEVVQQFIENTYAPHASHPAEVSVSTAETPAPIAVASSPEITQPSTAVVTETVAASHATEQVDTRAHDQAATNDQVTTQVEQAPVLVAPPPAPAVVEVVPVVSAPAPVVMPAPVSVTPTASAESLEDVLKSAGLTMAVTNPEKLRQVQEATATTAEPPRAPRERKPAPPAASEPLVQIETQR